MPRRAPLDAGDYHQADAADLYNRYYDGLRTTQSKEILRGLTALHPPPLQLLDIGCGNGLFVAQAIQAGYTSRGIDTSLPPREACHVPDRLKQRSAGDEAARGDTFDIVSVLNVLEHVADPDGFLGIVTRLLRPGGVLVCSMPLSSGMIYVLCEWLYRATGGSAVIPLKTVLQWHMATPHVFLPTIGGIRQLMQRHFGSSPEGVSNQPIVDVRNLSSRIALERRQRHVTAWENIVLFCGGHALGTLGAIASKLGRPDEVFFFVRRRIDA